LLPPGQADRAISETVLSALPRHQVDSRILASSINFEVEFKLVALVQLAHPGPFHGTDVHERVGLPVITGDKAKALHGVEELDRAGGLFASQLTLRARRRGSSRLRGCDHVANNLQIGGRNLSATIDQVEFELLTFSQAFETGAFDRADVHEHIFAAVFTLDEAKALLRVEELHDALAGADHLGRHAATAACTAAWAAEAAATAAARAAEAAAAATIAAAEAATITAAKAAAITAAETTTIAATKATATTTAAETAVGIEIVFAETVALVASATPPSIKTHRNQ